MFIDAEPIERDGAVVSYWAKQVLRRPDDPATLISAYMRTDCKKREESWPVVTRYRAGDERLDTSSTSYANAQPWSPGDWVKPSLILCAPLTLGYLPLSHRDR